MESAASNLPTILGSLAALIVAFISLMAGVEPLTCALRAAGAFAVFTAFGLIIRFLLGDAPDGSSSSKDENFSIPPGASVGDILNGSEDIPPDDRSS